MHDANLITLLLMALGAAFVQRVSGFGFGIFIMTVLPYLMPSYGEATTLSGLLASVTSCIIVARHWRYIHWRNLLPILTVFLIFSYIAIDFLGRTSDTILHIMLGAALIAASLWFYAFSDRIRLPATLPTQVSMGTLSGILGGLFGMQGPPAVLYFLSAESDKRCYMALAQTYFLMGNAVMTCFRASHGYLTPTVMTAWCYGILAVIAGTWIGSCVYRRLSMPVLRKVIYAYMAVSGAIAICQAL